MIFISVFISLAVPYYPEKDGRALWKFLMTCNTLMLAFIFRSRVLKCLGYPLKHLKDLGFRCRFTRIRMKIMDRLCFFYILFAEFIHSAQLITQPFPSKVEKRVFLAIVIINALYILFWLFCTNSRSFNSFPKE